MKLTYKQRIFIYFFVIFALFATSIIIFEQREERKYRTDDMIARLDRYSDIIHNYIDLNKLNSDTSITKLKGLVDVLPTDVRITIVSRDGVVTYDRDITDLKSLENHMDRPEIMNAQYLNIGYNIRFSASTQHEYIYYAKKYDTYYVRVALPYNIETQSLLKADSLFIYIVISMFIIVLILLNYTAGRFSKSISKLKNFTTQIKNNEPLPQNVDFPKDELGEIGNEVVEIFNQKEKIKHKIELEREKLIRHFQFSEEGLSIFTRDCKKIYANTHFIQYLNLIEDKPVLNAESVFNDDKFAPLIQFLNDKEREKNHSIFQISQNGKIFSIQTIVFEDGSFEITIRNITKIEKNRLLKQEMTNNIAHELRTPVASLRAYLETLQDHNLPQEKQEQFIERAYQQSIRLSDLIEDVSLISKIEEVSTQFTTEPVNILQILNEVRIDLSDKLEKNHVKLVMDNIQENLSIHGNRTLVYSIFRNLIDNSIAYGGLNIEIHINNYMEDDRFLYFSYYDTGKGVEEQYLNRLFERFYRVNEGRTRDTGGSGLGLSIVKNAVLFHKGEIQVKNKVGAGLEFLFTLKK